MKTLEITKEQIKDSAIELSNFHDIAELFFSETTEKFHIMFNAKMIFGSKSFESFKRFAEALMNNHNLNF